MNAIFLRFLLILSCYSTAFPAVTHYVDLNSTNAVPPYPDWSRAATNIQDAIDVANNGDGILVAAGLYTNGQRYVSGKGYTRVAVTKPVTLQSVSGPENTTIACYGLLRCVYLTNEAFLSGFSLAGGGTPSSADAIGAGGALYCESPSAVASNCIVRSSRAFWQGAGVYGGTLVNCTVLGNSIYALASGGGAWNSALTNCVVWQNRCGGDGGGIYGGTADNCYFYGNSANQTGGAAANATLRNCQFTGNTAGNLGNVARECVLNNCTVVNNSNYPTSTLVASTLNNCIVYSNGYSNPNWNGCVINYSCITPLPTTGVGNITNAPLLVDLLYNGILHLNSNSPCINSGNNAYTLGPADLAGNPRISAGTVDMGACEFQNPGSAISFAWLRRYALPTDGSADRLDPDSDGMNNLQEWIADTDPTNAASVLRLLTITATGSPPITVSWQSSSNRAYFIECATNLSGQPAFSSLQSNIIGAFPTTSFTATNAQAAGRAVYRVGVTFP